MKKADKTENGISFNNQNLSQKMGGNAENGVSFNDQIASKKMGAKLKTEKYNRKYIWQKRKPESHSKAKIN